MNLVGALVIFAISWWLCLFAVLPVGVRSQYEDGEVTDGTEEAAPSDPMLKKKAVWATIGAVVVTALVGLIIIPVLKTIY